MKYYHVSLSGGSLNFFKWRSSVHVRPASHQVRNKARAGIASGSAAVERCAERVFWLTAHEPPNAVRPVSCSVTERSGPPVDRRPNSSTVHGRWSARVTVGRAASLVRNRTRHRHRVWLVADASKPVGRPMVCRRGAERGQAVCRLTVRCSARSQKSSNRRKHSNAIFPFPDHTVYFFSSTASCLIASTI